DQVAVGSDGGDRLGCPGRIGTGRRIGDDHFSGLDPGGARGVIKEAQGQLLGSSREDIKPPGVQGRWWVNEAAPGKGSVKGRAVFGGNLDPGTWPRENDA